VLGRRLGVAAKGNDLDVGGLVASAAGARGLSTVRDLHLQRACRNAGRQGFEVWTAYDAARENDAVEIYG
jgi:hypothetical protein